ncbi:MAG: hypothetical protein Q7R83_03400 [bacterium]|nr:hypothetical protein [bacterium]
MPLIHIHDLIVNTWEDYKKYWNGALSIGVWYLVGPAIYFFLSLIARYAPSFQETAVMLGAAFTVVLFLWTTIRLTHWLLFSVLKRPVAKNNYRLAAMWLLPFLWAMILINVATVGGVILFVLPGIWLLVAFKFWPYLLLETDVRGTQALAASAALVKHRWWATFWRLLLPQLLFVLILTCAAGFMMSIVGIIAGASKMEILLNNGTQLNPLIFAIRQVVEGLIQMLFMPLFILVEVKLYQNLKETRIV